MRSSAARARRAGEAHALLARSARGDDFGVTIAQALARASGLPDARGFFFRASRTRIAPVGVADDGEVETRSVPSTLDTTPWATGDKRSGYAPFGYVDGGWLTVQIRLGKELVAGAIVQSRGDVAEDDTLLRQEVEGVAAHAAAIIGLRTALADAERAAATDMLTGLASRGSFMAQLNRTPFARDPYVVFLIDLDGLKGVNDTHGHAAGDRMIRDAAHALRRTVRADESVGRLGGDEFGVLCRADETEAPIIVERLTSALADVGISASVGFAKVEKSGEAALEKADAEMYVMKSSRRRARLQSINGGRVQ
jgi:diguanylate cyclase (GGDEF)-like protein